MEIPTLPGLARQALALPGQQGDVGQYILQNGRYVRAPGYVPATGSTFTSQARAEAVGYRPATWGKNESVQLTHPGVRIPGPTPPQTSADRSYITEQAWNTPHTQNSINIWAARYTGQALAYGYRPNTVSPGVAKHLQMASLSVDDTMQGWGYYKGSDGNYHATQPAAATSTYSGGGGGGGGGYGGGGGGGGEGGGMGLVNWRIGF